jgi:heme-degrading monooxygenase HmoA
MINVGLYYNVKAGHEAEFESIFAGVVKFLKENFNGFEKAAIYKKVESDSSAVEYMVYSEWKDIDSFRTFISSKEFRETTSYGNTIIEGRPYHKVFTEVR